MMTVAPMSGTPCSSNTCPLIVFVFDGGACTSSDSYAAFRDGNSPDPDPFAEAVIRGIVRAHSMTAVRRSQ